jgi:hypothetical protein
MKKLLMLTAAAGMIFALAEPTFAAQRTHRGFDAYASSVDRSGPYYYGPLYGQGRAAYGQAQSYAAPLDQPNSPAEHIYDRAPTNSPPNLPYPDRPYGDPDSW